MDSNAVNHLRGVLGDIALQFYTKIPHIFHLTFRLIAVPPPMLWWRNMDSPWIHHGFNQLRGVFGDIPLQLCAYIPPHLRADCSASANFIANFIANFLHVHDFSFLLAIKLPVNLPARTPPPTTSFAPSNFRHRIIAPFILVHSIGVQLPVSTLCCRLRQVRIHPRNFKLDSLEAEFLCTANIAGTFPHATTLNCCAHTKLMSIVCSSTAVASTSSHVNFSFNSPVHENFVLNAASSSSVLYNML